MTEDNLKKILVVDDEEEVLTHLANILRQARYEVIVTTRGKEAVELAKSQKPDLIILDIVMPDILGGEVAQILSQDGSTSGIPIIVLSALNTEEDTRIMREKAGNYHLLAKPVTREEVLEAVSKVLAV